MANQFSGTKLNINIDRATKQRAQALAAQQGLSLSAYVRQLIYQADQGGRP